MRLPVAEHAFALLTLFAFSGAPASPRRFHSPHARSAIRAIPLSIESQECERSHSFDERYANAREVAARLAVIDRRRVRLERGARLYWPSLRVRAQFRPDGHELREALISVLMTSCLSPVGDADPILIVEGACEGLTAWPIFGDPPKAPTIELVRLRALDPEVAAETIAPFKSREGGISIVPDARTLVITDTEPNTTHLVALVEALDEIQRLRLAFNPAAPVARTHRD